MGLTSEFVWYRREKDNFKRKYVRKENLSRTEKETKVYTTSGNHSNKDTRVIMDNVTVSFLCLLAAPWDGGRVPHQTFKALEVYETHITIRQRKQYDNLKYKGNNNCHC